MKKLLLFSFIFLLGLSVWVWRHPYLKTLREVGLPFASQKQFFMVVSENNGDIFNKPFFETLHALTDELFFMPEIDRTSVESIFMPQARYLENIEDGFSGGPIIPENFSYSPEEFEIVRKRIRRSSLWGQLASKDLRTATIHGKLMPGISWRRFQSQLKALKNKYTRDSITITFRETLSHQDTLVVFAVAQKNACVDYSSMAAIEEFQQSLKSQDSISRVISLESIAKHANVLYHEGNPKWESLPKNRYLLAQSVGNVEPSTGLLNFDCSVMPIVLFMKDHTAHSMQPLIQEIERLNRKYNSGNISFRIGAGNALLWALLYNLFRV